jgi:hypothetical protein
MKEDILEALNSCENNNDVIKFIYGIPEPIEDVEEDEVLGESTDNPYDWTQLKNLISEKYEVIRTDYQDTSEEDDGCIPIYKIYPKEYSD